MRGRRARPFPAPASPGIPALLALLFIAAPHRAGAFFEEDFEQHFFEEDPALYSKDHSLVSGPAGLYHLFYIVGQAGQSWEEPGNEVDFGHATSPDLVHWTLHPRVLPIDPAHGWKSRNVWAPHVVRLPPQIANGYLMAYTGVDSSFNQGIGIAVSADLFDWQDLSVGAPAFTPDTSWALWDTNNGWSNCRDPFVLVQGGELDLIVTAKTRPGYLGLASRGALGLAHSSNALSWTDAGAPLVLNDDWSLMESAHLAGSPVTGGWHLFYTRTADPGGIHVLASDSALAGWDIDGDQSFDGTAIASELLETPQVLSRVVTYRTLDGTQTRSVRLDSLSWSGDTPQLRPVLDFWRRWNLVAGSLTGLPTMHDRPAARTGTPSNMEGTFWINTAETYGGPYGGSCPTCGPDEAATGVLRSIAFTLLGSTLELRVGGSASPDCYVALVDSASGEQLRQAGGSGSDVMTQHSWSIAELAGRRVYLEIVDLDVAGHLGVDAVRERGPAVTAPGGAPPGAARTTLQLAPNPCRGGTVIRLELAAPAARAQLAIYDVQGRLVRRLGARPLAAGAHRYAWDGRTAAGNRAAAGVYWVRLAAGAYGGGGRPAPVLAAPLVLRR